MRFLLLGILLVSTPLARGATDNGQRYLGLYFLIREAEAAEEAGDWVSADAKFTGALKVLEEIKADAPDWEPTLIAYRMKYCNDHLAAIKPKLPPPPKPVAVGTGDMPAAPNESEQVQQLQAELAKTRDEVKRLEQTRDDLISKFEAKLKEPAPTDRASAQEVLAQLHAMQAANEAMTAKLGAAKEKANRADALEADLQQAREKITTLEAERTGLNAKLQEALTKVEGTGSTAQVEELMKTNADLIGQLATAQAEITSLRDSLTPGDAAKRDAAETVKLRTELGQLVSELAQTKALLVQRTEELSNTRAELEKVRAENIHLTQSQDEMILRLNDSDRQLRSAKASTEKDNEIIQQLRKENALLRDVATKKTTEAKAPPKPKGGFLWFKPKPAPTNTAPVVARSEDSKLTASVKAPPPPSAAREPESAAAPARAPAPAKPSTALQGLLADARAAIARRDLDTAATKLQAVLVQDPNNTYALSNLGVVYYRQGKLDEAEEALRKAVAAAPNDSQARAVLGVVCYRKGRLEDAYNELTRAVALDPRNAEAHNYLGIVMSEKGWTTAAEQEVRRAIEINPQYADAHFNLAVIYSREKTPHLELARYHYQKARDLGAERDPQLESVLAAAPATPPKPVPAAPAAPDAAPPAQP